MKKSDTELLGLELTGVFVHNIRGVIVTSETEVGSNKGIDHTNVYWYNEDENKWYFLAQWPNAIISSTFLPLSPLERFFLTANGKVYRRIKSEITQEIIDTSDEGPSDLLLMKSIKEIEGEIIAVGMGRRAYKRNKSGQWKPIDQTCFVKRLERKESIGFNDVAGIDMNNIVAVGYKGEIWYYNGDSWKEELSPTKVTLTGIVQISSTEFIICGLKGLIIKGSFGNWNVLKQNITTSDFWGIASFHGKCFVSNYDGVYIINDSNIEKCYPEVNQKNKTAYLSSGSNSIWSVGLQSVAKSLNGIDWIEIENP